MKNLYIIEGDTTYIYLQRRSGEILETIIDTEDLPRIESYGRKIQADFKKNVNSHYAKMCPEIMLHRFIMNAPKGMVVDHINHNTLDNRKSNLRICTYSENSQNLKGASSRSKSGIRGVCFDNKYKNWIAVVRKENKTVYRKTFDSMEAAEEAVIAARQQYLGSM